MKKIQANADQITELLQYTFKNNIELASTGKTPTAISILGEAGIGKTHVVNDAAKDAGISQFKTLVLSQLDELGDLIGFPQKEYLLQKDGKGKWVEEKLIDTFFTQGYTALNKTRMGYSKPAWLPDTKEPIVLFLDDWTRK